MIPRKKIIAGNWKMNKTQAEACALVTDLLQDIGRFDEAEIVVCPPFTALAAVSELLNPVSNIRLGAQNLHEAPPAPTPAKSPPRCSANSTSATSSSAIPSAASISTRTMRRSTARPRPPCRPSCAPSSASAKRCPSASRITGKKCWKPRLPQGLAGLTEK